MTDASFDQTVSVLAPELLDIGRRLWVLGAICIALKGDCRRTDDRAATLLPGRGSAAISWSAQPKQIVMSGLIGPENPRKDQRFVAGRQNDLPHTPHQAGQKTGA
jgi:hypothetical protein